MEGPFVAESAHRPSGTAPSRLSAGLSALPATPHESRFDVAPLSFPLSFPSLRRPTRSAARLAADPPPSAHHAAVERQIGHMAQLPSAFLTASRDRSCSAQKFLTLRPASFSSRTVRCEFHPPPKSWKPLGLSILLCVSTSRVRSPSDCSS